MRKALVAVGVDRTSSGFPLLRAAASGARQMGVWARNQGFDVHVLTDEDARDVTLNGVFKAVSNVVNANVYSQLIVYFSGHGILLSPDAEVWLLSGALDNPNEAVNVSGSIVAARTCGIEHVIFVSDACRSMPAGFRMGMVSPGLIFPTRTPRAPLPEVDVFYASLPGDPALEVPPDEAYKAFRGLLTSCLLKALGGEPQTLVQPFDDAGVIRNVVASRPLKAHLVKAVPDAATSVSIKLQQNPDVRVESALPKYIAEVVGGPEIPAPADESPASDFPLAGDESLAAATLSDAMVRSWRSAVFSHSAPGDATDIPELGDVRSEVDHIVQSTGRLSFETRTGFTVHGTAVIQALVTGTGCDIFEENGAFQVRVHEDYDGQRASYPKRAALLRFRNGTGILLAVLAGYIAAVVVDGDRVVTVNYTPSRGTDSFGLYQDTAGQLEQRRAFVAVAARHGSFRLDPGAAGETAAYLRSLKKLDPTLGLYAAYAYAQAGDNEGVVSVFRYMSQEPEPVLFDVAMLAAQRGESLARVLDFPPWLPMLTQGWMLLGEYEQAMPEPLRRARQHLIPGLWTTFSPQGVDILVQSMFGGGQR